MATRELKIEFIGRPHMRRSCLLIPVFLLFSAPVFGQSTSTDSQTLQALLAEVRQLHHDLQTTTIAAQRARILLYRLQGQEAIVARASQRLDDARARLAEVQSNRTKLTADIKKYEELVSQTENSPTDRKQIEDLLPQLKAKLAALENEEQQRQAREIEAEDELRTERAKLGELQVGLDRLEKILEGSGQQSAANPH
jgi:chromosome segregation ATPase